MNHSTGFFREAWLIVARGGWWSAKEIIEAMPLAVDIKAAHNALWAMSVRYSFLKAKGAQRTRRYAVTSDCTIPKGLTVGQAMEAVRGEVGK